MTDSLTIAIGTAFACREALRPSGSNQLESFLNKTVVPIALVGCLFYVYDHSDQDTQDSAIGLVSLNPVLGSYSGPAESAVQIEEEPRLWFGQYPCGNDCAEHLAGYKWAQENGASDPDNCDGPTAQFIEGCRVYAEERAIVVMAH